MTKFFRQFKTILVIDDAANPTFVPERLASFFNIENEHRIGDLVLTSCDPK